MLKIPPPPEYSSSDPAPQATGLDTFTGKQGFVFASPEEAVAGTEAGKMMSPLTTKHAIDNAVPDWATLEDAETGSSIDKIMSPAATRHAIESIAGPGGSGGDVPAWATPEEAVAGTEADKMMSPLTTKYAIEMISPTAADSAIDARINDGGNGLDELWSAGYLTGTVGDTAEMLDGILGDADEIAPLRGEPGATIIMSNIDPTDEGAIGDLYINRTTMQLFGPKTSEGWGAGADMRGAIGPAFSIDANHFFADEAARNNYFTANPSELAAGVLISIGAGYQQYSGSGWVTKTVYIAGLGDIQQALDMINGEDA